MKVLRKGASISSSNVMFSVCVSEIVPILPAVCSFRRRKKLRNAVEVGTRRTQTSPKNRRVDAETGRKSITETRSALTSTTAANQTPTPTAKAETKTRAATGSETKTKDAPKTETGRRTETGSENGRKTRRETKTETKRGIGILTATGRETGRNEETETKSRGKRESGTKKGMRGTKVETLLMARYLNLMPRTLLNVKRCHDLLCVLFVHRPEYQKSHRRNLAPKSPAKRAEPYRQ